MTLIKSRRPLFAAVESSMTQRLQTVYGRGEGEGGVKHKSCFCFPDNRFFEELRWKFLRYTNVEKNVGKYVGNWKNVVCGKCFKSKVTLLTKGAPFGGSVWNFQGILEKVVSQHWVFVPRNSCTPTIDIYKKPRCPTSNTTHVKICSGS